MARDFADKSAARQWVWDRLSAEGVGRFPFPPHGRIPNFAGAAVAAARLLDIEPWKSATAIKVNPDSPHRPLRAEALRRGITVFVPTPRLRGGFWKLDPHRIPPDKRAAIWATIDSIEAASGTRPVGWLGAGLAETWNTLDYLAEAGIRYVCDWVNDDQPYKFEVGTPPLVSLPYSVQTNDVPAYFEMKVSVPEFEAMLKRQFDTLYREGETVPRVMAIAVHPFVTGQPHRIGALDAALEYICSHAGVWRATGWEIVQHYLSQQP